METAIEHILTNSYKKEMIAYLRSHPDDFDDVLALALIKRQPYSRRAAWLLWSVMEENDPRIQNHLEAIVNVLPVMGEQQVKELLIILQRMDLPNKLTGKLFDICVSLWEKTGNKPSVRFNAFRLLVKIVKLHPGLAGELPLLMEPQYMESLSDTLKRSILRMAAGLDK